MNIDLPMTPEEVKQDDELRWTFLIVAIGFLFALGLLKLAELIGRYYGSL